MTPYCKVDPSNLLVPTHLCHIIGDVNKQYSMHVNRYLDYMSEAGEYSN